MSKSCVIVAPHCDDELIGCFEIINNQNNSIIIIYGDDADNKRREEALKLRELFPNIKLQVFHSSIPSTYVTKDVTLYVPDPYFENHPMHRAWGMMGEGFARMGFNVVFYTTQMNAPYIHETNDSTKKQAMLDRVYESQKDLWAYEKKYILFEGKCKWLF